MKNITKLAIVSLFGFAMFTTTIHAGSIDKGHKIYAQNIKGQCAETVIKYNSIAI